MHIMPNPYIHRLPITPHFQILQLPRTGSHHHEVNLPWTIMCDNTALVYSAQYTRYIRVLYNAGNFKDMGEDIILKLFQKNAMQTFFMDARLGI